MRLNLVRMAVLMFCLSLFLGYSLEAGAQTRRRPRPTATPRTPHRVEPVTPEVREATKGGSSQAQPEPANSQETTNGSEETDEPAQSRAPRPQPSNASLLQLGSAILGSATRIVSSDPYAQFRNARYSNDDLISEADELRLGREIDSQVRRRYRLAAEGQERAKRIGARVARASLRPNMPYNFAVIEDKELNAFATPGGNIYVTSGLLAVANDDELASVLAHEVGHVVGRHSLKTIQQTQTLGGIIEALGTVTGLAGDTGKEITTLAGRMLASGVLANYNRDEEREADYLGLRAMAKAGFDPQAMVTMFTKVVGMNKARPDLLGSIFRDHPDVEERIANTRYEIARLRRES